jgi:hypothetical protein
MRSTPAYVVSPHKVRKTPKHRRNSREASRASRLVRLEEPALNAFAITFADACRRRPADHETAAYTVSRTLPGAERAALGFQRARG